MTISNPLAATLINVFTSLGQLIGSGKAPAVEEIKAALSPDVLQAIGAKKEQMALALANIHSAVNKDLKIPFPVKKLFEANLDSVTIERTDKQNSNVVCYKLEVADLEQVRVVVEFSNNVDKSSSDGIQTIIFSQLDSGGSKVLTTTMPLKQSSSEWSAAIQFFNKYLKDVKVA